MHAMHDLYDFYYFVKVKRAIGATVESAEVNSGNADLSAHRA